MRGNTQALAVTTLAAPGAEQLIETMEISGKRRFMLHYNFPPYSVGEIGRMGGVGRREVGHGNLADKAIRPLIPSQDEFPTLFAWFLKFFLLTARLQWQAFAQLRCL